MGNGKNLEYKIFCSEDLDWFICAKKRAEGIKVLYAGDKMSGAYKSILKDIGVKVILQAHKEAIQGDNYIPTPDDFK